MARKSKKKVKSEVQLITNDETSVLDEKEVEEKLLINDVIAIKPAAPFTTKQGSDILNRYLVQENLHYKASDILKGVPVAYSLDDYIQFINKNF